MKACGVAHCWFPVSCVVQFVIDQLIIGTSHATTRFLLHLITIPALMISGLRIVVNVHGDDITKYRGQNSVRYAPENWCVQFRLDELRQSYR